MVSDLDTPLMPFSSPLPNEEPLSAMRALFETGEFDISDSREAHSHHEKFAADLWTETVEWHSPEGVRPFQGMSAGVDLTNPNVGGAPTPGALDIKPSPRAMNRNGPDTLVDVTLEEADLREIFSFRTPGPLHEFSISGTILPPEDSDILPPPVLGAGARRRPPDGLPAAETMSGVDLSRFDRNVTADLAAEPSARTLPAEKRERRMVIVLVRDASTETTLNAELAGFRAEVRRGHFQGAPALFVSGLFADQGHLLVARLSHKGLQASTGPDNSAPAQKVRAAHIALALALAAFAISLGVALWLMR